jgi:hypothetical protein
LSSAWLIVLLFGWVILKSWLWPCWKSREGRLKSRIYSHRTNIFYQASYGRISVERHLHLVSV